MLTKYHINSAGIPGKCRTWNCKISPEREHYSKSEALGKQKPEFELVPVRRKSRATIALYSKNPHELLTVALTGGSNDLFLLSQNQNADSLSLLEASTKIAYATKTRMLLECHKNFPVWALSGEAIGVKTSGKLLKEYSEELKDHSIFTSDDATDRILDEAKIFGFQGQSVSQGNEFARGLLGNSKNRLTEPTIFRYALMNNDFAKAAAESGRFPSKDLDFERNYFDSAKEYSELQKAVITAAEYAPEEKCVLIFQKTKNSVFALEVEEALKKNPNFPKDLLV